MDRTRVALVLVGATLLVTGATVISYDTELFTHSVDPEPVTEYIDDEDTVAGGYPDDERLAYDELSPEAQEAFRTALERARKGVEDDEYVIRGEGNEAADLEYGYGSGFQITYEGEVYSMYTRGGGRPQGLFGAFFGGFAALGGIGLLFFFGFWYPRSYRLGVSAALGALVVVALVSMDVGLPGHHSFEMAILGRNLTALAFGSLAWFAVNSAELGPAPSSVERDRKSFLRGLVTFSDGQDHAQEGTSGRGRWLLLFGAILFVAGFTALTFQPEVYNFGTESATPSSDAVEFSSFSERGQEVFLDALEGSTGSGLGYSHHTVWGAGNKPPEFRISESPYVVAYDGSYYELYLTGRELGILSRGASGFVVVVGLSLLIGGTWRSRSKRAAQTVLGSVAIVAAMTFLDVGFPVYLTLFPSVGVRILTFGVAAVALWIALGAVSDDSEPATPG